MAGNSLCIFVKHIELHYSTMSDVPMFPTTFMDKLSIESPSLSYAAKAVTRNVLFAVKIPYPLIKEWHNYLKQLKRKVDTEEESTYNIPKHYTDLLELSIPGNAFAISMDGSIREDIDKSLSIIAGTISQKYRKAQGSARRQELDKSYRYFHIFEGQTVDVKELEEKQQFLFDELLEWKRNHKNLEEEMGLLYEEIQNLTEEKSMVDELNAELLKYVDELEKSSSIVYKGKDVSEVKKKSRTLNAFMSRAKLALWFAKSFGLELDSLTVRETKTGTVHNLSANHSSTATRRRNEEENTIKPKIDCIPEDERRKVEQILFLLDKFAVGDSFYHELAMENTNMPRSYLIRQKRNQLNSMCHIVSTPGSAEGAQLPFKVLLKERIEAFLKSNDQFQTSSEPLRIKISGDGAKMTRHSNYILLSFAILQAGEDVMAARGVNTIAVVKGSEKYNTLKESFADVFKDINDTCAAKRITLDNGKKVKLEFFLGGDYKFSLLMLGMKGATSDYACCWCEVFKDNRWDMSFDVKHYNSEPLMRTLKTIKSNVSKKKDNKSCEYNPLLDIELDHVVLDELHLLLRIMDVLIKNLILEAKEWDCREDPKKKRGEPRKVHIEKLQQTIRSCGITFDIWEKKNADGKSAGEYDYTSLLGADKKKLLRELPDKLNSEVIHSNTCNTIVQLWKSFKDLYEVVTTMVPTKEQIDGYFKTAKSWINLFISLRDKRLGYRRANVTPYMHAMVFHIPLILKNYGTVKLFSGQGVEKNNDVARNTVLRKSNKWDAPKDVLLLEQRQWQLRDYDRSKRNYVKKKMEYWEEELQVIRKKQRNK